MSKPIIRIHDTLNDEILDREMTDAEYQDYLIEQDIEQKKQLAQAETTAKKTAAKAKLAALGLTTDDLKALGLG